MSDVNEDVQRASGEMRACREHVTYYLEYSVHRDVWYRLGGIGMTLYPWALQMLRTARQANSEHEQIVRKIHADDQVIDWRLTKQTTRTEVLDL
jgi:hypothetical protein